MKNKDISKVYQMSHLHVPVGRRLQRCRSLQIRRSALKQGAKLETRYRLAGEIGSGSFAVVYRAFSIDDPSQEVAIKVISKNKAGNELELIENEINLHSECDHPNVGKIYEVFDSPSSVAVVMEFITGGELFDRLVNSGKYCEKTAAEAFSQILQGVAHIHDVGIVHRDLKPENLMLRAPNSNHIKVVDFGLASSAEKPLTEFVGTIAYLAPELLAFRAYSPSNAPYSFACLLYTSPSPRD